MSLGKGRRCGSVWSRSPTPCPEACPPLTACPLAAVLCELWPRGLRASAPSRQGQLLPGSFCQRKVGPARPGPRVPRPQQGPQAASCAVGCGREGVCRRGPSLVSRPSVPLAPRRVTGPAVCASVSIPWPLTLRRLERVAAAGLLALTQSASPAVAGRLSPAFSGNFLQRETVT